MRKMKQVEQENWIIDQIRDKNKDERDERDEKKKKEDQQKVESFFEVEKEKNKPKDEYVSKTERNGDRDRYDRNERNENEKENRRGGRGGKYENRQERGNFGGGYRKDYDRGYVGEFANDQKEQKDYKNYNNQNEFKDHKDHQFKKDEYLCEYDVYNNKKSYIQKDNYSRYNQQSSGGNRGAHKKYRGGDKNYNNDDDFEDISGAYNNNDDWQQKFKEADDFINNEFCNNMKFNRSKGGLDQQGSGSGGYSAYYEERNNYSQNSAYRMGDSYYKKQGGRGGYRGNN